MYEPSGANLPASDVYFSSFWRCCPWVSTFLSSSFTYFWRSFISLCTWSTFFCKSSALFLRSSCPASTFFLRSSTFFLRSSWPASTFFLTSCLASSALPSKLFFTSCLDWSGTSPHPVATPTSNSPATMPSSNTRIFVMCALSSPSRIRAIAGCPRGRLDQLFGVVIHEHDLASHTDILADEHEPAMDYMPGAIWRTLFTGVLRREILRASPLRSSPKLARSEFVAAFLLQHLLAGASDLHTDVPKGAYGLLSLMPYAPKVFLIRPRAPVLFQPLVHPEDTP